MTWKSLYIVRNYNPVASITATCSAVLDAGWPHEGKKSAAKKQKNKGRGTEGLTAEASWAGHKESWLHPDPFRGSLLEFKRWLEKLKAYLKLARKRGVPAMRRFRAQWGGSRGPQRQMLLPLLGCGMRQPNRSNPLPGRNPTSQLRPSRPRGRVAIPPDGGAPPIAAASRSSRSLTCLGCHGWCTASAHGKAASAPCMEAGH